ncbi:phage integrase [Providencia rettgeri]|uniref:phage integrase n=1 Tax=Providencia rettgeri TaxID=587 RepID=UPI00235E9798|nr:tyrosine-type recombinase/integrase [Providencia rettgeri]
MSIKKLEDGRYEVDIRPTGRNGKRIRRKFNKKHEAIAFERYTLANHSEREWLPKLVDNRKLSELITQWWELFGKHAEHGVSHRKKAERVCNGLSDPAVSQLTNSRLSIYAEIRRAKGIKASTVNREITALRGVFSDLIKTNFYKGTHPLADFGKYKEQVPEMSYLTDEDIKLLLANLSGDNYNIAVLCLSTGARWGEAMKLKREHVIENRVRFTYTKTGKVRTVPISPEVAELICNNKKGLLFPNVRYKDFRRLLKEAKPSLPQGQAVHSLRHTFATHFMMNGGSIITLQKILGHSSLKQTLTYAHFAPDFLQDAISYNPLKGQAGMNKSVHTLTTP